MFLLETFGQPLSRSLWILYRTLEDLEENQNTSSLVKQKLREEICYVIVDLYSESIKLNIFLWRNLIFVFDK